MKRLKWEKTFRGWSESDWSKVLWADESKFLVFGSNR